MTKQKLGQHFLYDKKIGEKIVNSINDSKDTIIEIGPGRGIMTNILTGQAGERRIIAVEKDETLYNNLLTNENLKGVELLNKDILKLNIAEVSEGRSITILGNIPYYISKEIIDWIMRGSEFINSGTLLVQKEFFLKITSTPGSKIYNAQSVIFGLLFDSSKLFEVKPGSFSPPPKVTSVVFSFSQRGQALFSTDPPLIPLEEGGKLFTSLSKGGGEAGGIARLYTMLKTAFIHRRKTLINNLGKGYDKNTIKKFLETKSLPSDIRAEDMTREDLRELYLSLR